MKVRCKESPPGTTDSSFMHRQGKSFWHYWLEFHAEARKVLLALLTRVSDTGKESHSGTTDSSFRHRQGKPPWHYWLEFHAEAKKKSSWHYWLEFQAQARKVILALLILVSRRGKEGHPGNNDSSFNDSISHSTSLSTDHATALGEASLQHTHWVALWHYCGTQTWRTIIISFIIIIIIKSFLEYF